MLIDVIKDTLMDALKLIPFLFIAFLIIELLEDKLNNKMENRLKKANKFGPLFGSILGSIPQCGFSALSTNFYISRIISLGTLISVYLSTSDEMLPIMISSKGPIKDIILIIVLKVIIGFICGFIIDLFYKNKKDKIDFNVCQIDNCECEDEKSVLKATLIHTIKTTLYIIIISFIINILFELIGEDNLSKIFIKDNIFASFLAALIGLIPNCGASITLTEFYLNDIISLGTCIGGLLTGAGIGLLILFKNNKDKLENINILLILYLIGSVIGLFLNIIGV